MLLLPLKKILPLVIGLLMVHLVACDMIFGEKGPPIVIHNQQEESSVDSMQTVPLDIEKRLKNAGLVNINDVDKTIQVDLKYSTTDNFLHKDVYGPLNNCFLLPETAKMLRIAQLILRSSYPNYSIVVYDGVRPRSIQWIMWRAIDLPANEKTKFIANPANASLHQFGAAVDVSILDEKGEPLDMGTPYDFIGELAYPRLEKEMLDQGKLTQVQYTNRLLLRNAMTAASFTGITTEWWHFNSLSRDYARKRYSVIE